GVDEASISIIPDEQEAIDAALRMGQPGDLVLIFADALTRSWKQVIKFRADGAAPLRKAEATVPATVISADEAVTEIEGLVRDERGVRLGREEDD
ncbi:MAG: cyanophycin synthetase, partial [Frankiaceae bacterium]|nr:cyanophycin synthetase [Arenimonas sp.]